MRATRTQLSLRIRSHRMSLSFRADIVQVDAKSGEGTEGQRATKERTEIRRERAYGIFIQKCVRRDGGRKEYHRRDTAGGGAV